MRCVQCMATVTDMLCYVILLVLFPLYSTVSTECLVLKLGSGWSTQITAFHSAACTFQKRFAFF